MLTGGDTLHRYPPPGLPFRLVNNYGPTENTVVTTSEEIPPYTQADGVPTIGRPIDNTQVYILNPRLQPVPLGVVGELYIGGSGLARGYLHRPDLTAERFVPSPFSTQPGARLYHTGDLACYLPDGTIKFIGRFDRQVKIRGFRIELREIEVLLSTHPTIREALVLSHAKEDNDIYLVAYIASSQPSPPTASEQPINFRPFQGPSVSQPTPLTPIKRSSKTASGPILS